MNLETPETEHQARIKQIVEEGDKQYEAELQRLSKLAIKVDDPQPATNLPLASDLEKS